MAIKIIRKVPPQQGPPHQDLKAACVHLFPRVEDARDVPTSPRIVVAPIEEHAVRGQESWGASTRPPLAAARTATLATALTNLEASGLTPSAKRDISWAIRIFSRGTGRTPSDIAANASAIRAHLVTMSPAMLGLGSTSSFYNLKSLLRRGVRLVGMPMRPKVRDRTVALNAQWSPLFNKLPGRRAKARLGGFVTYCSAEGYDPANVEAGHVERYARVLECEGIDCNWSTTITRMVQEWNQAAADLDFWPKTPLHTPWTPIEAFTPPLEALPKAYQQSVNDYIGYLLDPPIEDELAPLKGLRPGSVPTRMFLLRYMAAVLRKNGWSDAELSSVNALVAAPAIDVLLEHKSPQQDGTGRAQYVVRLVVLKSIAKYWAAAPKTVIAKISRLIGRYAVKTHAMAPVNRKKLAELSGVDARANLLNLAPRVFHALHEVPSGELVERDATLALAALYVGLACMWPGRVGTLSKIHLTKNIRTSGHGRDKRVFLHFLAGEIKNGVPAEVELPPHLVSFLDVFLARYRPLLVRQPSDFLFPAKGGGPRSASTMYGSVTSITRRYVGKPVNPNLFRHFTSTVFLERRPGEYETVRRVLGHTSLDMAHQHYVGIDDRAAAARFDEVIRQAGKDSLSSQGRRRRQTRESLSSPLKLTKSRA